MDFPLAAYVKINHVALRHWIQNETHSQVPLFESYRKFCGMFGNDYVIDFPEFEFWFLRLSNGEIDDNRSRKPITFSDLPVEVVSEILAKLDPVSRIVARHVSNTFQSTLDRLPPTFRTVEINVNMDCVASIMFDQEQEITYNDTLETVEINYHDRIVKIKKNGFGGGLAKRLLVDDLKGFRTKVLEKMGFNVYSPLVRFSDLIPDGQLCARHLKVFSVSGNFIVDALSMTKPGLLEKIEIRTVVQDGVNFDTLASLEQWKRAKEVHSYQKGYFRNIDLAHFYHLSNFSMIQTVMNREDLIKLRDALLQSPTFQKCGINLQIEVKILDFEAIGDGIYGVQRHDKMMRIPIPNSADCLEFLLGDKLLTVEKKAME